MHMCLIGWRGCCSDRLFPWKVWKNTESFAGPGKLCEASSQPTCWLFSYMYRNLNVWLLFQRRKRCRNQTHVTFKFPFLNVISLKTVTNPHGKLELSLSSLSVLFSHNESWAASSYHFEIFLRFDAHVTFISRLFPSWKLSAASKMTLNVLKHVPFERGW